MSGIIQQRDIVEYMGKTYRVLEVEKFTILAVEMNTMKTVILLINKEELEINITNKVANFKEPQAADIRYIHPELLTGSSLRIYNEYKNVGEAFLKYSSSFGWLTNKQEKAEFIERIATENNISITTARRRLREYLQNGMTLRGLEAKYYNCGGKGKNRIFQKNNRPGRKGLSTIVRDEETIRIFDKMTSRYIASHGKKAISLIYEEMINSYYSDKAVVGGELVYNHYSVVARPSRRQLYYHIAKRMGNVEKYIAKNGYKNARNNIRPLQSDTIHSLEHQTIGDCYEMDEMETDYELVSSYDRNQVIGRGVMYLIKDVLSKMIVGYSVGIDNNSWAGAEMALLNMAEDKVRHCAKRGIQISHNDWPVSRVLPRMLLVDNGSEYLSKQYEEYARENGICLDYTESGMGSMKGNIEGEFRCFNLKTNGLLPGQIDKKDYGKPHERTARLTIEEFETIVIHFILNHNKNPMDSYKANREIFASGILKTPNNIWEYYMNKSNQLKKITDMDAYRLSLLCTDEARITREGIQFKQMLYTCEDQKWLSYEMSRAAIEKTKKLQIKYDRRCMDIIYYFADDATYKAAYLNKQKTTNEKYYGFTYEEVIAVNEMQSQSKISNEELRLGNNINFIANVKTIVKEANKQHKGINVSKNKHHNRMDTKERLHQEHNIVSQIEMEQCAMSTLLQNPEMVHAGKGKKTIEQIKQQRLLELMNLNNEEVTP